MIHLPSDASPFQESYNKMLSMQALSFNNRSVKVRLLDLNQLKGKSMGICYTSQFIKRVCNTCPQIFECRDPPASTFDSLHTRLSGNAWVFCLLHWGQQHASWNSTWWRFQRCWLLLQESGAISEVQYVTIRYDTIRYDTIRYNTMQYMKCDAMQCSAIQYKQ